MAFAFNFAGDDIDEDDHAASEGNGGISTGHTDPQSTETNIAISAAVQSHRLEELVGM